MKRKHSPDDFDDRAEFIAACVSDGGDEDDCALEWEERSLKRVVRKTHVSEGEGLTFILSDASPDRMGDVIEAGGWDLVNFKRNPVALFNHDPNFPIGKWHSLRVEGDELRGELRLAPLGTSARIDEIHKLVAADILKAVSVGFLPRQSEPLTKNGDGGVRFKRAELVETSLVAIPANPNALAVAKSLNISRETLATVFAEQGNKKDQSVERRGSPGGQADKTPKRRNPTMSGPLAKRIEAAQQRIIALGDQLTAHLDKVDDENVTEADLATTQEFNKRIADQKAMLKSFEDSEALAAKSSDDTTAARKVEVTTKVETGGRRPFSVGVKKLDPIEFLVRAGTITVLQKSPNFVGMSLDAIRQKIYGDDEATKVISDLTTKAGVNPAMTTVAGWAAELVQQMVVDLMPTLLPASVYPSLSGMGLKLSFGRNGRIVIPTRNVTPSIAGSFVGEGAPIPVRIAGFTSQTLTPKKMAVITTWTREMDEHSVPAIEGLLRESIQQDTAISIDAVLLDSGAATAIRPAGLLNGLSTLGATAGGGFAALVGDLQKLQAAILTATNGNIRNMVFLMNPSQALSISFIQPTVPGGLFPFAAEINSGKLNGHPVIQSGTVPDKTIICMDAADFVSVTGDTPRFEVSDQATLHMEDTTPLHIGTAGTPGTVAAPARSMFQTDSLALRLILPMNWIMRRSGVVSFISNVTW